jgi:hypothetical protein
LNSNNKVISLYVKITKNLDYRKVVQEGYQEANVRARHVITTMNNLIPGMTTLGNFIIESIACRHFYIEDQATKRTAQERLTAQCNKGHVGGARCNEACSTAPPSTQKQKQKQRQQHNNAAYQEQHLKFLQHRLLF